MKTKQSRQHWQIVSFLILTAIVIIACGGSPDPTATSQPVQEQPTQQPPQQPTNEPIIIPTNTTEPFVFPTAEVTQEVTEDVSEDPAWYVEEWDDDNSAWYTSVELNSDSGDVDEANIYTEDGKLVFEMGKWLIGYVFYDPWSYEDVRLDVEVENRGANTNNVLLVCRYTDEGLYLVNIANSGLYAMYAYDGPSETYYRMADGGSTRIKTGKETNTYSLICEGRDIILGINGYEVKKFTDNKYVFREGLVGVGVASEDVLPIKLEFEFVGISQP